MRPRRCLVVTILSFGFEDILFHLKDLFPEQRSGKASPAMSRTTAIVKALVGEGGIGKAYSLKVLNNQRNSPSTTKFLISPVDQLPLQD